MLPFILLGAAVVALLANAFSDDGELKINVSEKTNCHDDFLQFNECLAITPSKEKKIASARRILQKKIKEYFKEKTSTTTPLFYIQGSTKHGTIIRKHDDTCDIDVGVYFLNKPKIQVATIQKNIIKAIGNHTDRNAVLKNKCVRIHYANQFHIDFPIYYSDKNTKEYFFGTSDNDWQNSDPKLFTTWVNDNVVSNDQMVRVIRYFKAWADTAKCSKGQRMPSGLAFTIWVHEFYKKDRRDDIAFVKIANQILIALKNTPFDKWLCKMPVAPYDNVISKLTDEQKENFLKAVSELLKTAVENFKSDSKDQCLIGWRALLGNWFP